jgi:hypothetical protein
MAGPCSPFVCPAGAPLLARPQPHQDLPLDPLLSPNEPKPQAQNEATPKP